MATLYTCSICGRRLYKIKFTKETIDNGTFRCKDCYTKCKMCKQDLPISEFTKESISRCLYICKSCQSTAKYIAHQDILNAFNSHNKYESTNTLYIYHNPHNFRQLNYYTIIKGEKSKLTRHTFCPLSYNWDQVMLDDQLILNAYNDLLIQILSSPTPIFHVVKIDNVKVLLTLSKELKYSKQKTSLKVIHNQHQFSLQKYIHTWWY